MFFRDETKIPRVMYLCVMFWCILCPPPTATVANLIGEGFCSQWNRNNPGWSHLHRRGLFPSKIRSNRVLLTQFLKGTPRPWRKQRLFSGQQKSRNSLLYKWRLYLQYRYTMLYLLFQWSAFTRPEAEAEAVDAASLVESFTGGVPMAFFPGSRELAFGKLTGRWLEYHHFSYEIHRLNPGPAIPASYFRLRECKHKPSARLILLMTTRNPAREPPGMVIKPDVNNGINYQPQLVQDFWTINSSYDLLQETLAYKFQRFFLA